MFPMGEGISLPLLSCLGRWVTWDFCAYSHPFRWVQACRDLNSQANALRMLGAEADRGRAEVRAAVACFSLGKCINCLWYMQIWRCRVLCSALAALCICKTILPMRTLALPGVKKHSGTAKRALRNPFICS